MINKIFGIGMPRTGTWSLTAALKMLGYKVIRYPTNMKKIKKYHAATDTSVSCRWKQLDKMYPNSKFILPVRDLESWLLSCEDFLSKDKKLSIFEKDNRRKLFGSVWWHQGRFIESYYKHHTEVLEHFKDRPNDLLVISIVGGEGYEKLCPFLNKPIIKERFPYKNRGKYGKGNY